MRCNGCLHALATITANVAPQAFVDELLKKRRPFKDPGAGVEHGEYTLGPSNGRICLKLTFENGNSVQIFP
jgi:hypothetical protein